MEWVDRDFRSACAEDTACSVQHGCMRGYRNHAHVSVCIGSCDLLFVLERFASGSREDIESRIIFVRLYTILRPSAAFHLRAIQFAVKLKRNHSKRSGFPWLLQIAGSDAG